MNCAVAGTVAFSYDDSARMFIGWRMWTRASDTIAAGMVAENSIVWRVSGVLPDQLDDVGQEAEVEHLVRLVEHQRVDVGEVERAAVGEVDQPARRTDDDVDAGLERVELRVVADAAVDGEDAEAAVGAGQCEVAGDLERELAGRGDDQRLRLALRHLAVVGVLGRDRALEDRDAERQRLAGAGAGLPDQVGAQEGDRQGHLLDRERRGDAGAFEGVTDLGEHPEFTEGSQCSVRFR